MNKEILLVVDSVSNEKDMEKEVIFHAVERALEAVTAKRYPEEVDIRVAIDRKTGDYETFRRWAVIGDEEDLEFPAKQMTLTQALTLDEELEIGDLIEEPVESVEFGRISAQLAKQVIMREIRRAERENIIKHYMVLVDTLMMGVVKKVNRDNIILDIGSGVEAIILRDGVLPKEALRLHDRVRGILVNVREDSKGPLLVMSRTVPKMLIELFKLEVPEITEDVINVKAVARDPGLRAKIAVKTNDGRIDPIGACIGIRGSRVQNVSNELGGERIDVILWDDDSAQLVVNAMAPAEIASIVVDEDKKVMDIAVREDQLALAIGRSGQNVKLASELSGWKLNVVSVEEAERKVQTEASSLSSVFTENLAVDSDLANTLVQEGFRTLEDVAYAPVEELLSIEGFDKEIAETLRNRARDVLLEQALSSKSEAGTVEPAQDLLELEGMTRHLAYIFASKGIVTREDLAEQSIDDLSDIEELSKEDAAKLIMVARKPWFEE
ncbi:MAG: transcription termination factor NusA [Coxiellaceae bacterium]|jgi:N utilization substance protein A|nr:transcription termination factor NusA [Coxiellaceae bacterium]